MLTLAEYRRHRELRSVMARNPWDHERDEFYSLDRAMPEGDPIEWALERAEAAEAALAAECAAHAETRAVLEEVEATARHDIVNSERDDGQALDGHHFVTEARRRIAARKGGE